MKIKKVVAMYKTNIFIIGTIFVILSISLSLINLNLNNRLTYWMSQSEIWSVNFQQVIRNEEKAQSFLDVETIIKEINPNSSKIEKLRQAQKDYLLNSILIRYRVVFDDKLPSQELQKGWEQMALQELASLDNEYAEKSRLKYNEIISKQKAIRSVLNWTLSFSILFNVVGLLLIFIFDIITKQSRLNSGMKNGRLAKKV